MLLVKEETSTTVKSHNPLFAYIDASNRGKQALEAHSDFFESDEHVDRLEAVANIFKDFFGRLPSYYTPRGLGRKPFEAVKIDDVGRILSRTKMDVKIERLYKPLLELKNTEVISKNGHLIVRVYGS
jgi:hypothetical protein